MSRPELRRLWSQSNSITESSDTVEVFQDNKDCYKPELERGKEGDYIDQKKTKIKELKNSNCHSAKVHHQTQWIKSLEINMISGKRSKKKEQKKVDV